MTPISDRSPNTKDEYLSSLNVPRFSSPERCVSISIARLAYPSMFIVHTCAACLDPLGHSLTEQIETQRDRKTAHEWLWSRDYSKFRLLNCDLLTAVHIYCIMIGRAAPWSLGVGRRGRNRPFFNALSRSPVFNLSRACSEAPSQHALERGPMKEAIDFCRLQRGPFYLCPLGGWGRRSALGTRSDPWA